MQSKLSIFPPNDPYIIYVENLGIHHAIIFAVYPATASNHTFTFNFKHVYFNLQQKSSFVILNIYVTFSFFKIYYCYFFLTIHIIYIPYFLDYNINILPKFEAAAV